MSTWSCLKMYLLVFELMNGNIASGKKNPFELKKVSNDLNSNYWTDFQCKRSGLLGERGEDFV